MLSPRIGGWGGGGFDIYSDSSPLEIVSSPSLPPSPPLTFFVTIAYIEEIESFFIIGSFYLQSYTKQTVQNCWTLFTVFVPSLCWCRRFDKLTVINKIERMKRRPRRG